MQVSSNRNVARAIKRAMMLMTVSPETAIGSKRSLLRYWRLGSSSLCLRVQCLDLCAFAGMDVDGKSKQLEIAGMASVLSKNQARICS